MSTYVPECPDNSDVFVCLDRACKRDSKYFQCKDGKYCIFENLVCDGYAQCEDKSGIIGYNLKDKIMNNLFFLKMKAPAYVKHVLMKDTLVHSLKLLI